MKEVSVEIKYSLEYHMEISSILIEIFYYAFSFVCGQHTCDASCSTPKSEWTLHIIIGMVQPKIRSKNCETNEKEKWK